ncbi:MAG: CHAT domain-containing protein [Myxococcales bacterium]|nr:CHAT domain-containing protein [Myxococcales bacterium]
MREPDDDPCALTARYFDGEAGGDEARALDHLATCARCQAELGDLIGLDVALGRGAAAAATAPTARGDRRRWWLGGAAAAVVAAAVLIVVLRPSPRPAAPPTLALAPQRGVEVRFSAPAFAPHRPYAVNRGAAQHEAFALDQLAGLERRGDRAALVAAQASAGELGRAGEALAAQPASPGRDADRAAVEVLAGRPEAALTSANRALAAAPALAVARWNRGLALRDLGFDLAAASEFERISAGGEVGWADEARATAAALRAPVQARLDAFDAVTRAAEAMIDRTGPPLAVDFVRTVPGYARAYFLEAVRSATTADELRALAPLAEALDGAAGTAGARAMLDRALAADLRVRAPLARRYRDLFLRRLAVADAGPFLEQLARAGAAAVDLRVGALVLTNQDAVHPEEVERYAAAVDDPWFTLLAVGVRAEQDIARGATGPAEVRLREALATCDARAWGHRCAYLAYDLATLYVRQSRFADGAASAERAARGFAAVGAVAMESFVLSYLADIQRSRGRLDLAAAAFDEILARAPERDCTTRRFARTGLALVAVDHGPVERSIDPGPPTACDAAPSGLELVALVDLARGGGDDAAWTRAAAWVAAARGDAGEVAGAVLALARDPAAGARLRAALPRLDAADEELAAVRAWGYAALIDDGAARAAWPSVVADVAAERGRPVPPRCTLVASVDRTHAVAVAIDGSGALVGARVEAAVAAEIDGARLVPPALRATLASCAAIAVLARPPLHGRTDLLPTTTAWSFGDGAPRAASTSAGRLVTVGDARPPTSLGFPALAPPPIPAGARAVTGVAATPAQVLAALADASYAELHVHGEVDLAVADASFLALSPATDGQWALTAGDVRKAHFAAAPVVVLAACRAAAVAPFAHARWSLPDAFLAAGARAVIAPAVEIPDAEAGPFFDEVRARITGGELPAAAVAAVRAAAVARGQAWAAGVIVFE